LPSLPVEASFGVAPEESFIYNLNLASH